MIRPIEIVVGLAVSLSACASNSVDSTRDTDASTDGGIDTHSAPGQVTCDAAKTESECLSLGCSRWMRGVAHDITGVTPNLGDANSCVGDRVDWCVGPETGEGSDLCECMVVWKGDRVLRMNNVTDVFEASPTDWKRCDGSPGEPPECECATLFCKPGDC